MKTWHVLTAVSVTLSSLVALPEAGAQSKVPLIPRSVLFGNPNKATPRISPDGRWLSFLAPIDGVLNVWISPIHDPDAAQAVTQDANRGIRVYSWAHTSEHILYLQDQQGTNRWRLWTVDLATGEHEPLTPPNADARIQQTSAQFPTEVLVAINDRDPRHYDLYLVDIETGDKELVQANDGFDAFYTDDDFMIRLAARTTPEGGRELLFPGEEGEWVHFTPIPAEDVRATGPVGFDASGDVVYLIDSRGRDTAALKSVNLTTGSSKTLVKERDADVTGGVLISPVTREVQAAATYRDRRDWQVKNRGVKNDFKYLARVSNGDLSVVSRTADDQQWIVAFDMDTGPVEYYHYNRAEESHRFLFTNQSALERLPLAQMHARQIKTRDRLKLVSYLTLPVWADADFNGKPDTGPLPLVVWVHGGPWWREKWGYNPVHQWLANRGYAVLSVNFRGSTGFGKKFVAAGNGEWGGRMQEDLTDAVKWAVKEEIADSGSVAIMGGSYGGYAVLMALATTPDTFTCGVDLMGPANLFSFMSSMPGEPETLVETFATRVGDHRTEAGAAFLRDRSPITHAGQINRPLLVAQGANDTRALLSETQQLVSTVADNGVPVTFIVYPDEGQGFSRWENQISFLAISEGFLAEHLGGRAQPVGDDLTGSTLTIPIGAEQVAGVLTGAQ
ncbi:MAG: S9 family peptidase [Planctomycetota bacterium]|jgi:dipeptidyl aminopeptidase/acylaminoacyl peptidase